MELNSYRSSKRRYGVLRFVRILFQVLAVMVFVGAVFGCIAGLAVITEGAGYARKETPIILFAQILSLLFGSVVLVTAAQLIQLAIHVEENTRSTAQLLEDLADRLAPPSERDRGGYRGDEPGRYRERDDR